MTEEHKDEQKTEKRLPFVVSDRCLELVGELGIVPDNCDRVIIDIQAGSLVLVHAFLHGNTATEDIIKAIGEAEFHSVEGRLEICLGVNGHKLGCAHNKAFFGGGHDDVN